MDAKMFHDSGGVLFKTELGIYATHSLVSTSVCPMILNYTTKANLLGDKRAIAPGNMGREKFKARVLPCLDAYRNRLHSKTRAVLRDGDATSTDWLPDPLLTLLD